MLSITVQRAEVVDARELEAILPAIGVSQFVAPSDVVDTRGGGGVIATAGPHSFTLTEMVSILAAIDDEAEIEIETPMDLAAVEAIDDIVSARGIDGVVVGPRDLAMSMGFVDGPKHSEVDAAIARVTASVRRAGLVVGTVAGTGAQARSLVAAGYQIVLTSAAALLANAASSFLTDARRDAPGATS